MEVDPPENLKVKFIFLKQICPGTIFRYKKQWYKKVSLGRAISQNCSGLLEINSDNQYDGAAVSADADELDIYNDNSLNLTNEEIEDANKQINKNLTNPDDDWEKDDWLERFMT